MLAYQCLMMGHDDAAKTQLQTVIEKVPQDELAVDLFKKLGGVVPAAITKPGPGNAETAPPAAERSVPAAAPKGGKEN